MSRSLRLRYFPLSILSAAAVIITMFGSQASATTVTAAQATVSATAAATVPLVTAATLVATMAPTTAPTAAGTAAASISGGQSYHSDVYGVSFQYPADWVLHEQATTNTITLSSADDDKALQAGKTPGGVIFSLSFTTFHQLGVLQISDMSARLAAVAGAPNVAPHNVRIGGANGITIDLLDTNAGVAGRSAMLSIGQRRVAVVRGVASIHGWADGGAEAQYNSLISTLSFFAPASAVRDDQIGQVMWQTLDPRFSAFADIGATSDGTSVIATDPKQGIWTLNANGVIGDLKAYPGFGGYGSIALFRDSTRFVADPVNHMIWFIGADGQTKKVAGGTVGNTRGTFGAQSPQVFAIGFQSTINALDVTDKGTRIQTFARGGDFLSAWDITPVQDGKMAADPNGYLYIVGSNLAGVLKIGANGKVVATDLGKLALNGATLTAIEVDRFGNMYIGTADSGIIKLDANGNLLGVIGQPYDESASPKPGQLGHITALSLSTDTKTLYVADSGKYPQIVAVSVVDNVSTSAAAGTQDMGTITYGQTVNGTLTGDKFINTYTFTGKSGDLVTITMKAASGSTLDAFVELLGTDKARLAANDDAPTSAGLGKTDAQIVSFKLPYNGTFTIRATRFGRETTTATGAYTLAIDNH
jgi:hypothetical protein